MSVWTSSTRTEDSTVLESLQAQLAEHGVDLSALGCEGAAAVKVICVPSNLSHSLSSLAESPRDQVLMVRVDSNTAEALDAWYVEGVITVEEYEQAIERMDPRRGLRWNFRWGLGRLSAS